MSLLQTLTDLNTRIAAAAQGRAVRLMAVSKGVDVPRIAEALAAGQRLFGENYVQEAAAKWAALRAQYPDAKVHLIGPLQSNKAGEAVALFDRIDSVDRPKIVRALAEAMKKQNRQIPVLIEVNIGAEAQKHGCHESELPALLEKCYLMGLKVDGLMAIPPANTDPAPYFQHLKALAAQHDLTEISMGMSGDYETAIQHGSTLVRVGTALFGARG